MPASPKRLYFNELAPRWDELSGEDTAGRVTALVERMGPTPRPGWILDAGCGTGLLLPALSERYLPDCLILELDFAEQMLRVNAARHPVPGISRLCADVESLPIATGSVVLAVCFGLYPHLENPERALREFFRVLVPGGALTIAHLMSSSELNSFHSTVNGPVSEDRLPPARELARQLAELGAVCVSAEEQPGLYWVRGLKPAS